MKMNIDEEPLTPEVMLAFYRRLYPFKSIFSWLNQGHTPMKLFTQREFAFTLQGDVYLRYQSFNTADELKKQVCTMNPTRFEIGPQYTLRPRDKKLARPGTFQPVERELVFDIDMTDYDPIRTCCSDAAICSRCWAFIAVAVKVLDNSIRENFGYKHLLWVYSGRRGIHLWISDKEAMQLTDDQRRSLVGWMTVIQGSKDQHKKVNVRPALRPLPPTLSSMLGTLAEAFSQIILDDQDLFRSEEGWKELLHLLPKDFVDDLGDHWKGKDRSSEDKWKDVKKFVKTNGPQGSAKRRMYESALEDIILQYTYPRLDAEVSKHRNHLLKAPFCVHPKTGRVCVPVDPETIDDFDPGKVPTVGQLLRELHEAEDAEVGEHHSDWMKTSLKPYVEMLDKHATEIIVEVVRKKKEEGDKTW